jgi:hypothetical protein
MWALSTGLGFMSPFIASNFEVAPKVFRRLYTFEVPVHHATGVDGRIAVYLHAFFILAQDGGDRVRPAAGLDAMLSSHLPLPGDEPRISRIVGVPYVHPVTYVSKSTSTSYDGPVSTSG